jgi:replicative DNA helicase
MTTRTNHKKQSAKQTDNSYSRVQPQALEVERAVLGALMIDKNAFDSISNLLRPDSFYDPRNQKVFLAILELSQKNFPVDVLSVTEQLAHDGNLEEVGGPCYVTELSSRVASSANIEYHARVIAQKAVARQLIVITSNIEGRAFDETEDIDDLMQEAESRIFELSSQNLTNDYQQINYVLKVANDEIMEAKSNLDDVTGLHTGYEVLDSYTCGWQSTDLNIIAGRPGMGKTTFALCLARFLAEECQIPIAYFSLEMSSVQLVKRLISGISEVEGKKIKNGQYDQAELKRIDQGIGRLWDKPFYLDETPVLSIYELRTKVRRLVKEHGVKVVFIDYLQLMSASTTRYSTRQDEVSLISRSLKALAKETGTTILALSQMNRSVEAREGLEGKRPRLSDLRESGAIEQDADMVLFVHRPEVYGIIYDDNGKDLRGTAEIIIGKNRNGDTGLFLLTFKKEISAFVEYAGNISRGIHQANMKVNYDED